MCVGLCCRAFEGRSMSPRQKSRKRAGLRGRYNGQPGQMGRWKVSRSEIAPSPAVWVSPIHQNSRTGLHHVTADRAASTIARPQPGICSAVCWNECESSCGLDGPCLPVL